MKNLNDITIQTYRDHFGKYAEATPREVSGEYRKWIDTFTSYLPRNGKILELGSATGRDARYLSSNGFKVICTDIIPEALKKLESEGFEISEYDFRDEPKSEWINQFDGLFANGVLLHATDDGLENALKNIRTVLKKKGIVGFSLKIGKGEEVSEEKVGAPRYFNYHNEEEIKNLLTDLSFEILDTFHADKNKWLNIVMRVT